MANKILVTGATGTIGKAVVKALQNKRASFVAGVRNVEKATELLGNEIELKTFDFNEPATFENATKGVDKVFLLGPPLVVNLTEMLTPFVDFLKYKGVKRVVYVGALQLEVLPELNFHTLMIDKLQSEGFDYTILKPSFFAQNFKNYEWENIVERGITYVVAGAGKVGFIDVQDIGNVAASVLTEEGHVHKEYELTGPELLNYADAANLLSNVTGRKISYPNPTAEQYTAALKAAGAPDFVAGYMIPVYSLIKDGHVSYLTNDVENITGQKPTGLQEVLKRDFASV